MCKWIDFLKGEEVNQFIKDHVNEDVQKIILNPPKQLKEHIKLIADQILARQKAKGKLDRWASNFDLIMPPSLSVEQASSEKTAKYKKQIAKGEKLVDLTGGMGIDSLALSENFNSTTYVEADLRLCEAFSHNSSVFEKDIRVINKDALEFIKGLNHHQDVTFFLDPARRDSAKRKVFRLEDCSPNLEELLPDLKRKSKQVLIKLSPLLDISAALEQLRYVKEVHVVSVRNECKELLFLLHFEFKGEPVIHTINLESDKEQVFSFLRSEENKAESNYIEPLKFLYEPNASILKAGAFHKIGKDFGLNKIHPNTHFYTSEERVKNWPGRVFEVLEKIADKKETKKYAPQGFMNVMTRNYPIKTEELKKKYRLKDGGDYFLIGFRSHGKASLLIGLLMS